MSESTQPTPTPSTATPGATKIVKLGESTLLITEIENAADMPEGEYTIQKITVLPKPPEPGGAAEPTCGAQCYEQCRLQLFGFPLIFTLLLASSPYLLA